MLSLTLSLSLTSHYSTTHSFLKQQQKKQVEETPLNHIIAHKVIINQVSQSVSHSDNQSLSYPFLPLFFPLLLTLFMSNRPPHSPLSLLPFSSVRFLPSPSQSKTIILSYPYKHLPLKDEGQDMKVIHRTNQQITPTNSLPSQPTNQLNRTHTIISGQIPQK